MLGKGGQDVTQWVKVLATQVWWLEVEPVNQCDCIELTSDLHSVPSYVLVCVCTTHTQAHSHRADIIVINNTIIFFKVIKWATEASRLLKSLCCPSAYIRWLTTAYNCSFRGSHVMVSSGLCGQLHTGLSLCQLLSLSHGYQSPVATNGWLYLQT